MPFCARKRKEHTNKTRNKPRKLKACFRLLLLLPSSSRVLPRKRRFGFAVHGPRPSRPPAAGLAFLSQARPGLGPDLTVAEADRFSRLLLSPPTACLLPLRSVRPVAQPPPAPLAPHACAANPRGEQGWTPAEQAGSQGEPRSSSLANRRLSHRKLISADEDGAVCVRRDRPRERACARSLAPASEPGRAANTLGPSCPRAGASPAPARTARCRLAQKRA